MIHILRKPSSIGLGLYCSPYFSGETTDATADEIGLRLRTPSVTATIPQCYLYPTGVNYPGVPINELVLGNLIQSAGFSRPVFYADNTAFPTTGEVYYHDLHWIGARIAANPRITLGRHSTWTYAIMGNRSSPRNRVALLSDVGAPLSGDVPFATAGSPANLHIYDANNNDSFTPITLTNSEPQIPEFDVAFGLGNYQVDKVERVDDDFFIYASLSERIPRGTYTWTTAEEVITEVYQEGDEWKARGERLTVTAEITGEHWT